MNTSKSVTWIKVDNENGWTVEKHPEDVSPSDFSIVTVEYLTQKNPRLAQDVKNVLFSKSVTARAASDAALLTKKLEKIKTLRPLVFERIEGGKVYWYSLATILAICNLVRDAYHITTLYMSATEPSLSVGTGNEEELVIDLGV